MRVKESLDDLRRVIRSHVPKKASPSVPVLPKEQAKRLFESMLITRHLDLAAQRLREAEVGHYTIASAGHEGNVVLGALTRVTDLALLHYRDAAVQVERSRQVSGVDPIRDILLSLVASSLDPLCKGRHKALGNPKLGIIPQTSTIASHLPRAMGLAFALARRHKQERFEQYPNDAVILASFGDGSINHSTALGAFNAASYSVHQNLKVPLLCVCEDNGLAISVRTPENWVSTRLRSLPHFAYFFARSYHVDEAFDAASRAIEHVRTTRKPAVLHLECRRLLGHAGSDVDTTYRGREELEEAMALDPLRVFATELLSDGRATSVELLDMDAEVERRVEELWDQVTRAPKLDSAAAVLESLCRPVPTGFAPIPSLRAQPEEPMTLAQGINFSLEQALSDPDVLLFGEDVAKKGGVYGVTRGLLQKKGAFSVFNTLLDEQSILGLALGAANLGFLPIPEIQYLAYLHNAEDQLRGEAASLPFFSGGSFDNPMIVRIAGLAYQKGFGGHFHNDNSLAVLRDLPGVVVCVPARADDAIGLFQTALHLVRQHRRVVVMIEPIALYHTRDLLEQGDFGWLASAGAPAPFARARAYHSDATDLLIVTYGNGLHLSLQARHELLVRHQVRARVLDLRWLAPLPMEDIVSHADATGSVLVVDECRASGSVSEAILAHLAIERRGLPVERATSLDSFVPLGNAANLVLVQAPEVVEKALALVARS